MGIGEVLCEISLTPAAGLGGRVLDRLSGNRVRGARVTLFKRIPGFFSGGGFKFLGSDWAPSGGCQAEGDDARFRLEIAAAGSYLLTAQGGEGTVAQGWLGPLDLEPGGRANELTLHVGGSAALAVTVRDARTGGALEGIGIVLTPVDGYPIWLFAKTDGSGSALHSSAPAGKYRLEAQSPSHLSFFEDVVLGDEAQLGREVSLEPASWIAVELGGSANPSRDYVVKATLVSGGDPAWPYSSADGRSLTMASTRGAGGPRGAAQATPDLKVRLKTRAGRYTIHFEVLSPHLNSPSILAQDLELDVPEDGEASVLLFLPKN